MLEFEGAFADGQTAVLRPVRLLVGAQTISLMGLDGAPIETWPFSRLTLAEEVYPGQPARIINSERRGASIRISEPEAITEICRRIPRLRSRDLSGWKPSSRFVFWLSTMVATIALLLLGVPRLADVGARLVPTDWAQALGQEIVETMPGTACEGEAGGQALHELTLRLANQVSLPVTLEVQVRDSDGINAFAAPGGQIVVLSGLLDNAESPEELAGVLAHEIGHVVERHPMRGLLRQVGLTLVVAAVVGDVSTLATLAADFGKQIAVMSYSRDDEAAADDIAIDILNSSNIRGDGLVDFFERLQGATLSDYVPHLELLESHPGVEERLVKIRERVTGQGDAMSAAAWQSLRAICQ